MRNILFCLMIILFPLASQAVERTEAQRYYDLGMSYLMSELYEQGLETLNQVAFLYPDSDVADDALYQLALIREDVGDGKVIIASIQSLELQDDLIERSAERLGKAAELSFQADNNTQRIIIHLATFLANIVDEAETKRIDEIITAPTKRRAIAQYLTALDYLTILTARYPESDRMAEVNNAVERISGKIEALIPKPPPEPKESSAKKLTPEQERQLKIVRWGVAGFMASLVILIIVANTI
jgi:tetratricopeptide (TPR) repeat protein